MFPVTEYKKKDEMRLQSFIECDPKCVKDDLSQIRISGERERPEMGNIMMMTNITMSKHRFASPFVALVSLSSSVVVKFDRNYLKNS